MKNIFIAGAYSMFIVTAVILFIQFLAYILNVKFDDIANGCLLVVGSLVSVALACVFIAHADEKKIDLCRDF